MKLRKTKALPGATRQRTKVMMERIEDHLQTELDRLGVKSMNTKHGTVFRTYKEFASIADFDALVNYIKEHDAYDLFERRVSKTAVRGIMEEDADGNYINEPPPGVNFVRKETVQIRRS